MSALLYLQFHSFINRQKVRLKRLKRPKYLIGGIVGGLYFYFYFFRFVFGVGRRPTVSFQISADYLQIAEAVAASVLFVIVLLAWVIPHGRAALTFTEAEVSFLFPAPISRRTLVHFKLLKSQMAILFTTLLLTLISGRFGGGGAAWIRALGWWIFLSTLNLHFLGSSFTRTMLLDRGITNWKRRLIVFLIVGTTAAIVFIWSRRTIPTFDLSDVRDLQRAKQYLREFAIAGPVPYLLYPFRIVVRPFLASNAMSFLAVLGPALLLLLLHYSWVIRANVAFEEGSIDLSRRIAERICTVRSGNLQARPTKARGSPFTLSPVGPPAVALLWKNLIGAGQMFSGRVWLIVTIALIPTLIFFFSQPASSGLAMRIGMGSLMVAISCFMIGPQFCRQDLRQDLVIADVLKALPVRGWQLVLGELLAPTTILTSLEWILLATSAACLWGVPELRAVPLQWRAAIGLAVLMVLPMLNAVLLI